MPPAPNWGSPVRSAIRVHAPAKVNLALAVGPRDADGYHAVQTVLQAVALWDDLEFRPHECLHVWCDDLAVGDGRRNLVWQAADALRRAAGCTAGVSIRIHKRIPVQAGLGGGSTDAAAALWACNRLWGLRWPVERLAAVASSLGADVPFFLVGGTGLGRGRGDQVRRMPPLPAWPLVLARAGAGASTANTYAAFDRLGLARGTLALPAPWTRPAGPAACRRELAAMLFNDLQPAALLDRPDTRAVLERLTSRGAFAAMVAGSGSAVWALAPSLAWARTAAAALAAEGVWAVATRFWPGGLRPGLVRRAL